jgi:hypothetical protein
MSEPEKAFNVTKLLRTGRDGVMDRWAALTLRLTSSHGYQRLQGTIAKPMLLAIALFRKTSESAMSQVLAQLNMPSREEVLGLSQRMTHIEMMLDDVGAALDQLRRSAAAARPQRAAARDRDGNSEPRAVSAKEA